MDQFSFGVACPPALIEAMAPDFDRLGVETFPVEATGWTRPRELYRLWKILRRFRPDIVHSHLCRATFVVAPLARAARIAQVIETYHGREAWRENSSFWVDRLIARQVDRILNPES